MRRLKLLPPALLVVLTACEAPGPSELDGAIQSLLMGPLMVGDVESRSGQAASRMVAFGNEAGGEYLFIVSNISTDGDDAVPITVQFQAPSAGVVTARLEGSEVRGEEESPPPEGGRIGLPGSDAPPDDGGFHLWHLDRDRRLVESMIGHLPEGERRLLLETGAARQAVPDVGDIIELNVNALEGCQNPDLREARVEAVSDHAIVVADTRNPETFTTADFERVAREFDRQVIPLANANFGAPAREIGPDRTTILYTVAVNELVSGFGGLVGGFFFSRDLFPRTARDRFQGCPASNEREMFYLLAPDPLGRFGQAVSTNFVRSRTLATVMHEHQHLVNASRRLFIVGSSSLEHVWLNEALSHISEELLFYLESGLSPGQNITIEALRQSQDRLDAVNSFQVQNLARYRLYLMDPSDETPINPSDGLETRGAAWSFLRYVTDIHVDDDAAFFFSLVNSRDVGVANLENRLGRSLSGPLYRWDVSNVADDLVPGLSRIYRQPSWNFRSLLPELDDEGRFPLTAEPISPGQTLSWTIRGGSAVFMRLSVPAGSEAVLTTRSGNGPPTGTVRTTLVRIQ